MIVQRVEKQIIKKSDKYFSMLDNFCFLSKNLYNHANYIVRQEFTKNKRWIQYYDLDKMLKNDAEYPDYKNMPSSQAAQQTIRLLDKNWKAFFRAIKDWTKHKEKYTGRPKLPGYKIKNGRQVLILTNQVTKIKENGIIHFPKTFKGFTLKFKGIEKSNFVSFNQIRFIPHKSKIVAEIVYSINTIDYELDSERYISIDIGVDNLATVTNNFNEHPYIINGKPLKSINQFYNKQVAYYQSIAKSMNNLYRTKRIKRITNTRNSKVEDYMHKASRQIIDYCLKHKIKNIIIGRNKQWKTESNMGKRTNQNFIQIPHFRFIEMIQYKAQEYSIAVILTEESYTSGTSFIDNETPCKEVYNKTRRIFRGLFKTNNGTLINSDVNGSLQIMKKVVPNEMILWNRGCVLHPFVVNIA